MNFYKSKFGIKILFIEDSFKLSFDVLIKNQHKMHLMRKAMAANPTKTTVIIIVQKAAFTPFSRSAQQPWNSMCTYFLERDLA